MKLQVACRVGYHRPATIASLTGVLILGVLIPSGASAHDRFHRRGPVARPAALAKCGTYKNSWFAGYGGTVGQGATEGAYAALTTRAGAACGSDHNGRHNAVSSWALIGSGSNNGGYVQSGFQAGYGMCFTYFAQTHKNNSSGAQTKYSGCIATDGSTHGYAEQYGSGCGCEYAKIDGRVFMTTSFNPYSYWGYPFTPQFFGEANYRESDMPGNAGAPTDFGSLEGQNGSNNNFYSLACNGYLTKGNDGAATRSDGKAWYDRTTTCPAFKIYTDVAGH